MTPKQKAIPGFSHYLHPYSPRPGIQGDPRLWQMQSLLKLSIRACDADSRHLVQEVVVTQWGQAKLSGK